jgi:cytochrome bd-type quinol oxidase subunit 1
MKLRNTHTLISAYVALATIAAGLLAYSVLRPEQARQTFGELTIDPVTKAQPDRIATRSVPADQQMVVQ